MLPSMETIRRIVLGAEEKRRWMLDQGMSEEEAERSIAPELELAQSIALRDLTYDDLVERSGMVVRATGKALVDGAASISVVDRLFQVSNKWLRVIASEIEGTPWPKGLSMSLAGVAPGSFCFGIRPPAVLEDADTMIGGRETGWESMADKAMNIAALVCAAWVREGEDGVRRTVEDPAVRDATLLMLHALSPSARGRVDSLGIDRRGIRSLRPLSREDRARLKEAIKKIYAPKRGSFIGVVREVDLDAKRFELRKVKDIGAIRCMVADEDALAGLLGKYVAVFGLYEEDKQGRPRLMKVESIQPLDQPGLLSSE